MYNIYYIIQGISRYNITSIGAKSSFSRPAVVKVVDQLELFNHSLH